MSYYIMVIDHQTQFKNGNDFLAWYNDVTEWKDDINYNDYHHTTKNLQQWFLEIKDIVKPLNGEFAPSDEELDNGEYLEADYSIGTDFIYVGLALSDADKTSQIAFELARKHKLTYFDVSGTNELYYPDGQHFFVEEQPILNKALNEPKESKNILIIFILLVLGIILIICAIQFKRFLFA